MNFEHLCQIVNGYLKLLATKHGNCHVIISQTLTSIINRVAVLNKLHLLTKVGISLLLCWAVRVYMCTFVCVKTSTTLTYKYLK